MTPPVAPIPAPTPMDEAKPYRLLITGSRDATPEMLQRAFDVVARAKANGWEIVVGDASGVDTAVVNACKELQVFGDCYGIEDKPRCGYSDYLNYIQVTHTLVEGNQDRWLVPGANYLERDRQMVRHAQRCYAIWNGKSRGTKYTFDYARKRGIPTDVAVFRMVKA